MEVEKEILAVAKPGDVVFLKVKGTITPDIAKVMGEHFSSLQEKTGVFCVILDDSVDVARIKNEQNS